MSNFLAPIIGLLVALIGKMLLGSTFFRPLTMDDAGYVLDELTGLAPHNMGPPILVNSEGIPLADNFQRFVPGNDGLANVCLYFFLCFMVFCR